MKIHALFLIPKNERNSVRCMNCRQELLYPSASSKASSRRMISAVFFTVAATKSVHCALRSGEFFSLPFVRTRQQVAPQYSLKKSWISFESLKQRFTLGSPGVFRPKK